MGNYRPVILETSIEEDSRFNKYELDTEWDLQPELYLKWSDAWADACLDRDELKETLDLVKATLDLEIREDPSEFGIDAGKKLTESAISSIILMQDKYKAASERYMKAVNQANKMLGAKIAMDHRKKALENETVLWVGGFYSSPKIPSEAREESEKTTAEAIRESLSSSGRKRRKEV